MVGMKRYIDSPKGSPILRTSSAVSVLSFSVRKSRRN